MPRVILKCPYLKAGSFRFSNHVANLVTYMATREGVKTIPSMIVEDKNLIDKRKNYVDYIANRPGAEKVSSHGLFTSGNEKLNLSKISKEIGSHKGNIWLPIISLKRDDAVTTGFDNAERWHDMLSGYAIEIAEVLKISADNFRWYAAFHNAETHPHVHMICYSINPKEGYLTDKGIEKMKAGLVKNIFKDEMQVIYAEQSRRSDALKADSRNMLLQLIAEMSEGVIQNQRIKELFLELKKKLNHTNGKRVYGYLPPNIKNIVDEIIDELSKEDVVAKAYMLWQEMRNQVILSYSDTVPEMIPLSEQKEFKSIKNFIISEADKYSKSKISLTEIEQIDIDRVEFQNIISDNLSDEDTAEPMSLSDFIMDETEDDATKQESPNPYVKWSEDYKQARKFLFGTGTEEPDFEKAMEHLNAESQKGNVLAVYDLGRMYADTLGVETNEEKAQEYYERALEGFLFVENKKAWKYTQYRIGKMFAQGLGSQQDYEVAAEWLSKSANEKYKYAEYSLGGLYYYGQGVEQIYEKAFELYLRSAKQGFPYADFEVAKMFRDSIGTEKDIQKSNIYFQKSFVGFEALEKQNNDDKLQYRLGWMLQNGIGTEKDITRAKEYFQKSANLGNHFACYSLTKLILARENSTEEEVMSAIEYLKISSESGNPFAQYSLAKIYYEGKHITQDIIKAMKLFTLSAEKNNEWATYSLGKIYLTEEGCKNISSAVLWLTKSAEKKNQFAQYQLGKLYLKGEDVPQDIGKAVKYLTDSAEQGNQYAQYILGKLFLFGQGVPKDKETAVKWFTLSAEQGNEYAKFFMNNIDKLRENSVVFEVSRLLHQMGRIFEDTIPINKGAVGLNMDSKLLRKLKEKKKAQGHKQDDYEPHISLSHK